MSAEATLDQAIVELDKLPAAPEIMRVMRQLLTFATLLTMSICASAAEQAVAPGLAFNSSQEAVLLTANKVTAAAERCDFKIDDAKMATLLRGVGVGSRDMEVKKQSKSLKDAVSSYIKSFKDNKEAVCSEALREYGTDGMSGDLLSK